MSRDDRFVDYLKDFAKAPVESSIYLGLSLAFNTYYFLEERMLRLGANDNVRRLSMSLATLVR